MKKKTLIFWWIVCMVGFLSALLIVMIGKHTDMIIPMSLCGFGVILLTSAIADKEYKD